jgi:hypothetical protein
MLMADSARTIMTTGCRLHGRCEFCLACLSPRTTNTSSTLSEHGSSVAYVVPAASEAKAVEAEATSDNAPEKETDASSTPTEPKESKVLVDPIRWFGILVPPALRSAQASFASSVEGDIPKLCTLATDLRRQEVDIGRLRKQIKKL